MHLSLTGVYNETAVKKREKRKKENSFLWTRQAVSIGREKQRERQKQKPGNESKGGGRLFREMAKNSIVLKSEPMRGH